MVLLTFKVHYRMISKYCYIFNFGMMRYCVHMRPQTSHMLNLKAVRSSVEMESFTLEIILQQESGYEAFSGVLEMNFEHLVLESGFFHTSKSCQ